jgi:hypothetical protein
MAVVLGIYEDGVVFIELMVRIMIHYDGIDA